MILLIDNYDSFTHNLVHLLRRGGRRVEVHRNDALSVADVTRRNPEALVISPGPGSPGRAGISMDVIREVLGKIPILGVCLGHQALGEAFGARVVAAPEVVHGKQSPIHHGGVGLFRGIPSPFPAMRYHSLVLETDSIPPSFEVTCRLHDTNATVMGIRHKASPAEGIQFHPESFMTPWGYRIIENFLEEALG